MPKFQKNTGFTMRSGNKKLPFKLMSSSPVKEEPEEAFDTQNNNNIDNINKTLEETQKRGRYTFDIETGEIKDPKEGVVSREDKDLASKYQNTLTKANLTKDKINEQIKSKTEKRQKKLSSLTTQRENLESQIEKTTDDDKLKELNKQLKKAQRKETRATKKAEKTPKGNLLTRMKSNFQEKSLKNQRRFINMSDDERRSFKQMKANNIAEMLRASGPSNYKPDIQHDLKAFMNPDANKLTNTTFSDMYKRAFQEGIKSAQQTTPGADEEYKTEYEG